MREVLEETGIRTKFDFLVGFRHMHEYKHGMADIYFVCALKPLSFEIEIDKYEIAAAKWMKVRKLFI